MSEIGPNPQGENRKTILRRLGWSSSTLTTRIKGLKKEGIVKERKGTRPIIYYLPYKGKQRLAELQNSRILAPQDCLNDNHRLVSLQQYRIKFPIIESDDGTHWPSKIVKMNNWVQKISEWRNCTEIIHGESSVEIRVKMLLGHCEHQLENYARGIADAHVSMLCSRYAFRVGLGERIGKPEFEVKSSIAREEVRLYRWLPSVRDMSVFGDDQYADFVFHEARDVTSFKSIPRMQNEMWKELQRLSSCVDSLEIKLDLVGSLFCNIIRQLEKEN